MCADRPGLGNVAGRRTEHLRHEFHAMHQGRAELEEDRQLACGPNATGQTMMDSTVRYLDVDIKDALFLSEGIDL